MKKLALAIALVSAASASQAAVYNLVSYDYKNNYTGGFQPIAAFTSGSANVTGPVMTFTNVAIETFGTGAVNYSGGTWIFNAITNQLSSTGAGTCTGSCTGIFAVGAPVAPLSFISDAMGPASAFSITSPAAGFVAQQLRFNIAEAPAVPVPAAAWLMGSGLVGLAGIARRRKMA